LPRRKISDQSLTPLELEIMNILWETGSANVQAVQGRIEGRSLAYTTVQTMLNVLHRKGKVKRLLKDRAYEYRPILSRQKAVKQAVGDILDRFFDAGDLLSVLVGDFNPELFFERHHQLDRVERVGAKIVDELRVLLHLGRFDTEMLDDYLLNALGNIAHFLVLPISPKSCRPRDWRFRRLLT